jgi:hypothetical protein
VGENSGQRAVKVYSTVVATYNAPKYSAPIGDAFKGQEGSGLPFTACSEALKKTDIDGICKHLDEVCGQTNDTDKLISCTRACHGECSKKHGN